MQKTIFLIACFFGLSANGLGAFGAHALRNKVADNMLAAYQTGVQYQFYHSFALLIVGLLMFHFNHALLQFSALAFTIGILLFSGSLYLMCVTNTRALGIITPFGGITLIVGWCLFIGAFLKTEIFSS